MEPTTSNNTNHHEHHEKNVNPIMEAFEQMSQGKVSGDNWMVDECGNLKIMLHNHTAENLDETSECCQELAVFDVKVMIATNCLQKKAWKRGIEYSKEKYSKDKMPKEIIINL